MPLHIEIDQAGVEPGEVVHGRVRGLEAWSDAREVRVGLRHRTKHLKEETGAEAALSAARSGEASFALTVPPDAYPTFEGERFESRWKVEAVVDLRLKRDVTAETEVRVFPGRAPEPPASPEVGEWEGYRRFRQFLGVFAVVDLALLAGVWVVVGRVPGPVLFALLVPALLSLVALGLLAVAGASVDRLALSLPRTAWRFGETLPVEVTLESDPDAVAALTVTLRGEEVWVTSSGQATTTHRATIHEEIHQLAGADLEAARRGSRRWIWSVDLALPPTGPPSRGKDVRWAVRASATVPRRPDPVTSVDLEVAGRVGGAAR